MLIRAGLIGRTYWVTVPDMLRAIERTAVGRIASAFISTRDRPTREVSMSTQGGCTSALATKHCLKIR